MCGALTLTSLSAGSGLNGSCVTLTGTGLGRATAVRFTGTAAAFSVVNATALTATVPTGLTTVTTPGGTNGVVCTATPALAAVLGLLADVP
jgi:hypothetical protein